MRGKFIRPFSKSSQVKCRGYSLPLERALTDFGADLPFGKAVEKMKEHYGIDVPSSTTRLITEKHAYKVAKLKKAQQHHEKILVSETDGSMVPIVEIDSLKKAEKGDARKARKVLWKEVKLSFAGGKDKTNRFYEGGICTAEEAGEKTGSFLVAKMGGKLGPSCYHSFKPAEDWESIQGNILKMCFGG